MMGFVPVREIQLMVKCQRNGRTDGEEGVLNSSWGSFKAMFSYCFVF